MTDIFEGFKKKLNVNVRIERIAKSFPIFVARVDNLSSLSQVLQKIALRIMK